MYYFKSIQFLKCIHILAEDSNFRQNCLALRKVTGQSLRWAAANATLWHKLGELGINHNFCRSQFCTFVRKCPAMTRKKKDSHCSTLEKFEKKFKWQTKKINTSV